MLIRPFTALGLCLLVSSQALRATAPGEITMASWPDLSPDGKTLVFEWRDDLWRVDSKGGRAERLTAHPARDSFPQYSPDGGTLYFCSSRSGFLQLFSMPATGGPATQHTFHSEGASLEDISPDGTRALVRGLRDEPGFRPERLIEIDLRREAPERYLFNEKGNSASYSPDGSKVLFCREGEQLYRKGYRGPRAAAIWQYEIATRTFTPLVKEETEARSPLWKPDGAGFYYVSERDGAFNLWSRDFATGEDTRLTRFKGDGIVRPAISADGSTIVFRRGFDLWRYLPLEGGEPEKIRIYQEEDLPDTTREVRNVTGASDADFSPSGLEIVFCAEGELWTMDTVLREPNRVTHTEARESNALFAHDGQSVYYLRDDGVDCNIWRVRRKGAEDFWWRAESFEHEQITRGPEPKRRFTLSPDGTRLAYIAGTDLVVANADGSSPKVLFPCWDAPTFDWSPDSGWLVFAAQDQNFNRDIYIVPADGSKEPFNLSRHPDFEGSPCWSPDGRRIAFLGRRLNNEMGLFYVDLKIREAVRSPRDRREIEAESAMRDDPLYRNDTERDDDNETGDDRPPADGEALAPDEIPDLVEKPRRKRMSIDFDGLTDRIVRLNSRGIEPERLVWSHDSSHILFQSRNSSNDTLYRIEARPGASMETVIGHRGLPLRMTGDGSFYWIVNRAPAVLAKGKLKRFPIPSTRLVRDRIGHQRLCFRLTWRTLRDRFYDPSMNGRDWPKILAKYEEAAAHAPDSATFDGIVGMMLGELNASHLTFISSAWPKPWADEGAEFQTTRHLGIRFGRRGPGDPLTVASVIPGSPAATCSPPVQPGDTIVTINGRRVDGSMPVHSFMNGRMDRKIELVVRDAQGRRHRHSLQPISYTRARDLAETGKILENRRRVEEWSGGRVGYIHIARMFWDEFEEFERQIYTAGHGKEGLIIDVRENSGGFITDHLLTVLCQPRHAVTIPRGGGPGYPQDRKVYASWHKPLVVLCDQNTFSNGEIFAHAIKTLERGTVIGVPTAGGVISAVRSRILDAGTLRVPFRGWFLPDSGADMEMNGAQPDIVIWPDPADLVAGKDKQLEKAVETLLKDVEAIEDAPFIPKYRSGFSPDAGEAVSQEN